MFTRRQANLLSEKQPFDLLRLPPEVQFNVFDHLIPKKIRLRRRYTGKGGNSAVARVFELLHAGPKLRDNLLAYISSKKPIFSLSIHDAQFFPLLKVRRLELRGIEFDQYTIFRADNHQRDCLPTLDTENAIEVFSESWTGRCIDELTLVFSMAPNSHYKGVCFSTNRTVTSAFAPLGQFTKLRVHYNLNNVVWNAEERCVQAFVVVAKELRMIERRQITA
jgi:hypothetical protein